jgi:fucose 4-O-acetylase-like acetyltransferase
MEQVINPFLSAKFRFWSFVSMLLLVYVHGYNLHETYLQSTTFPGEAMTATTFTEYLFSNGLLRFRIPMLFLISGYLFALGDAQPYAKRALKRLRRLGVPYILWTIIGLGVMYAVPKIDANWHLAAKNTYMNLWEDQGFLNARWWEYLMWFPLNSPVSFQLWFLRALLFLNLMYPGLKWCIEYSRVSRTIFFWVVASLWLTNFEFPIFYSEGVLFFSAGMWYAKHGSLPAALPWGTKVWQWALVWVCLASIKTWLAFHPIDAYISGEYMTMHVLHKLVVGTGLFVAWYGLDGLVRACMANKAFVWLSAFSFFIYALHEPFLHIAMQWSFLYTKAYPMYRILTYVFVSTGVAWLCVLIGWLFRTLLPPVYGVLTGERGMKAAPRLANSQSTTHVSA